MNRVSFFDQQLRPATPRVTSECVSASKLIKCPGRVSAVRLIPKPEGDMKLGGLIQIEAGTLLEICGEGYNERTVKVRAGKEFFCVFRQDIF